MKEREPSYRDPHHRGHAQRVARAFFDRHGGVAGTVVDARAHRWRCARGRAISAQPDALFDDAAAVAVCGDWLAGERVEGALTSGLAAAGFILGGHARRPDL